MRLGVDGGNGCTCDRCGKALRSRQAFKLKILCLHEDPKKASTGVMRTIYSKDLCAKCRDDLKRWISDDRTE